jgi:hypothetical protein
MLLLSSSNARPLRAHAANGATTTNDVLEDAGVVGRIFLSPAAPPSRQWMWASGHGGHHIERAAHGYAPTREAAMAAFAKSWRKG